MPRTQRHEEKIQIKSANCSEHGYLVIKLPSRSIRGGSTARCGITSSLIMIGIYTLVWCRGEIIRPWTMPLLLSQWAWKLFSIRFEKNLHRMLRSSNRCFFFAWIYFQIIPQHKSYSNEWSFSLLRWSNHDETREYFPSQEYKYLKLLSQHLRTFFSTIEFAANGRGSQPWLNWLFNEISPNCCHRRLAAPSSKRRPTARLLSMIEGSSPEKCRWRI